MYRSREAFQSDDAKVELVGNVSLSGAYPGPVGNWDSALGEHTDLLTPSRCGGSTLKTARGSSQLARTAVSTPTPHLALTRLPL